MDIARKNRMINLDLLRIIAMIMIVSLHFLSYCGILDETIDEINRVVLTHKSGNKLEGKLYTNGNINKDV